MGKKFKFKSLLIPLIIGAGACISAIVDSKKEDKMDELIDKIDRLETSKEEKESE